MEDIEKEIFNEKYPKPVYIEGIKIISEQMQKSICKIYKKDGNKGTGFFCEIPYQQGKMKVMITNYHVLDDKYIKENDKIEISFNDDKENKSININNKKKIYTNKEYDTTIIEITNKDDINNYIKYMEIDEKYFKNPNIIYEKSIYLIHYPSGEKEAVSFGLINRIDKYNIEHYCSTQHGSSGSPILNLINNKIIEIHKEAINSRKVNRGTLLKYPINEFINSIYNNNMNNNKMNYENMNNNNIIYNNMNNNNINYNNMNNNNMNNNNFNYEKKFNNNMNNNNMIFNNMNNNYLNNFNNNYNMNPQQFFNHKMNNINNNIKKIKLKKYPHKIGLKNLSDASYMNASLQCLFNIESLSEKLLNKYPTLNKKTQQLACEYITLLSELYNSTSKSIDPSKFKSIIGELNPLFQGNQDSDPKELIFFIIERLHQELKPPINQSKSLLDIYQKELISQNDQLSFQNFINDLKNDNSCIFDTFYGIKKIEIKCNNCNITKYSYQTFNMLNFKLKEIKDDKIKNIGEYYAGIDTFDAFENLRKLKIFDKIYCNNCKCMASGSSQEKIFSLPPLLIIVLNRGKNDQDFKEEFNFPESFDFSLENFQIYKNSYKKYYLNGIIKYVGESRTNCHYISFWRNTINEKFVKYDDTLVSENCEIEEAMKCIIHENNNENVTPYILFYHYY